MKITSTNIRLMAFRILIGIMMLPSILEIVSAVSHIPQFVDATTSPAGDVDVSAGDAHL